MPSFKLFSTLEENAFSATRVVINAKALVGNYRALCEATGRAADDPGNFCVVKADAYGHSNEICAPALAEAGCLRFAVSSVYEASALRKILDDAGFPNREILILGYTSPSDAAVLYENRITQCVYSEEYASALSSALPGKIKIHIKLDTGMNRIGFRAQSRDDVALSRDAILRVAALENFEVEGIFTHFARADERTSDGDAFTRLQFERFTAVCDALAAAGLDIPFKHVCNSAGAIRFPEFALDGVRFGIMLYGYGSDEVKLRPVMRFETRISHVHELKAGESVGYGSTFTAERPVKLATVPVGYADGFVRAYAGATVGIVSPCGTVDAKTVGRICMDQCMIDVTGLDVKPGDRVILFGDNRERLTDLARRAGTIEYEGLCLVSSRVPIVKE